MAPQRNNDRHSGNTGTIPKTKVRNNCNVPQEAVTPTRRDMPSNLVTTSLDWVPVSEYNSRSNYSQSRKPTNNTSDHELTDLDNSASFESGFGRFVPVRPQPRALPLSSQSRDAPDHRDDVSVASGSGYLHPYAHSVQNGLIPQSNHAAAAVMIVNPSTPNAFAGNMTQPFNAPSNQNRNNLTRNLNQSRNNFDGNSNSSNTPPTSNSRAGTKTVNLMNNMYDQGQGSNTNLNDNVESSRSLGSALSSCGDAAAVERRLGQIREYIRVTSSLVDTMRGSEDEAYIEHTKEEYDELVEMVMKLKESESKLEDILTDKEPDNVEVPPDEADGSTLEIKELVPTTEASTSKSSDAAQPLKKVNNIENEQLNKSHQNIKAEDRKPEHEPKEIVHEVSLPDSILELEEEEANGDTLQITEVETTAVENEDHPESDNLNDVLKQNILSCVEKVALIEELKQRALSPSSEKRDEEKQDVVLRPMSVQSNGSVFSENELWQNEVKNKMELSQQRLSALKHQQQRLLKYQAETKQQLDEMNRQSQEIHPSTSQDMFGNQSRHHANQIGVATTLPQSTESIQNTESNDDRSHENRYSQRDDSRENIEGRQSESEEEEHIGSSERRVLSDKLAELQRKKMHMENLVSEFQKLQMATRLASAHNTYSSSADDSEDDDRSRKQSKSGNNMKNEDPFKMMEIKAIKTALQKTKDLMRSVEIYETDHNLPDVQEYSFQVPHSNINDNFSKSEGSSWSGQRHKYTNEHSHQQQNHEANIASLQELAQELRMETEKIMAERARVKDMISNKEQSRKQKKVNSDCESAAAAAAAATAAGPAERRQRELRAILAHKQRQLDELIQKQKQLSGSQDVQKAEADSRSPSAVNQSYNSEQEEPDSRSEQLTMEVRHPRDSALYRQSGDGTMGMRSANTIPSHMGSAYCSDSDNASRTKSNQRNRGRRRTPQDRQLDDNLSQSNMNLNQNVRLEPRMDSSNMTMVPPIQPLQSTIDPVNMPYPHMPTPPLWSYNKMNQDMRANQFTQNSHSQTMGRLLGSPPHPPFPPAMPYNMMMAYGGMPGAGVPGVGVGGAGMGAGAGVCGCACGWWCGGALWPQLAAAQRDIMALREQLAHLEERWRAETGSHTLNNQVPPGNRANNYWDNFRSYSRQNLLSANSKTNADGHLGPGPAPPQPLPERSHNAIQPAHPPKRNVNAEETSRRNTEEPTRRNLAPERSCSFSSAPDVLNVDAQTHNRNVNITNPIPEIVHTHANNINTSTNTLNTKNKSSSKLPAKNSERRNYDLDYSQTSNINISGSSEPNNANAVGLDTRDKAASKIFDLLKENVYSEVTALIGVNESHPNFLIQLFRELQMISSDSLRQKVLQSIRSVLAQYPALAEPNTSSERNTPHEETTETVSTTTNEVAAYQDDPVPSDNSHIPANGHSDGNVVRFLLLKSEEICTPELLDSLASLVVSSDSSQTHITKKNILDLLAKYEGARICDISGEILENLTIFSAEGSEEGQQATEPSESAMQDVAGSLNLLSTSNPQLHQLNGCPYDMWAGHVHVEVPSEPTDQGKVDLITCTEMQNGDLAEADQSCSGGGGGGEEPAHDLLPDVVDTDETTPTEAEAEWLGLDRVPTRLHMEGSSEKQKD